MLHHDERYPVLVACRVLNLPRSSYYYEPQIVDETALQDAIMEVLGEFPTYGSRRMKEQLRRAPHEIIVGRDRVRRVMREMGVQGKVKRRKARTTNSQHPYPRYPNLVKGLEVTYPDQVWVSDTPALAAQVQVSPTSDCGLSSSTWRLSWMCTHA
jgi:putative transposase